MPLNISEERRYIMRHLKVVLIDFHLMNLVGEKEYVIVSKHSLSTFCISVSGNLHVDVRNFRFDRLSI